MQRLIVYGSYGTLTKQISNGANYDLFMSADDEFPLVLQKKGLTYGGMKIYAYGKGGSLQYCGRCKEGTGIIK